MKERAKRIRAMIEPELVFEAKLISFPATRGTDPLTSHLAAYRAEVVQATIRVRVIRIHLAHPAGLTDDELRLEMGSDIKNDSSHRKRRNELEQEGYLEDSGTRRLTRTGSLAIVWRITNKGRRYFGVEVELVL